MAAPQALLRSAWWAPGKATTINGMLMGRSPVLDEWGLCLSNRRAVIGFSFGSTGCILFMVQPVLPGGRWVLTECCAADSWPGVGGCTVGSVIEDLRLVKKE
ncbi:hypothetical protein [Pseudomonas sp. S31]|uniref:hypothetical protein n=1 Tax=Pseudomonas sp. S31 TaxID=1564473 RepID=UPI0019119E74|nr:hypothetical protein [Pseudomonas sp. S31]